MMRHVATPPPDTLAQQPGHELARLQAALSLVETIAGLESEEQTGSQWPSGAISLADEPAARRRYEALAGETAAFAAAGIEALMRARLDTTSDLAPPARRLATEMRQAIRTMESMLRR